MSLIAHLRRNAVAYLALFIALGGTSYAVSRLPANSVDTKQIVDSAVTTRKLALGAVKAGRLGRLPGVNAFTREPTQQIGDAKFAAVHLRKEMFDVGNMHSLSANDTRINIPRTGTYVVQGTAFFAGGVCGGSPRVALIQRHFRKGGTVDVDHTNSQALCGELTRVHGGAVVRLNAGDYLELLTFQRSSPSVGVAGRLSAAYVGG